MVKKKVHQVDIVFDNNDPEYVSNGSYEGVNPKVNSSPWCNFPTLFYLSGPLEIGILLLLLETGLVLSY